MKLFKDFFDRDKFIESLNATFLGLIQKEKIKGVEVRNFKLLAWLVVFTNQLLKSSQIG